MTDTSSTASATTPAAPTTPATATAAPTPPPRSTWTHLSDERLLAQCGVDTYRASGPGGQKRNKTSSAVRLRHAPTGLIVIAEESRSQHTNRVQALKRLRQALYLHYRDPIEPLTSASVTAHPDFPHVLDAAGRLPGRVRDPRFWPAAGVVLDVLEAARGQVSRAAELLRVSTAQLVEFLRRDPKLWQEANRLRNRHGHKPLR